MHALLGQPLDHLLTELAQGDAVPRQFRMLLEHPDHVAARRVVIHAQQNVGRRKMEKAQRVGLHELAAVHQFAQLDRCFRNAHGP